MSSVELASLCIGKVLELEGLDERHGFWGQFGTEISCKSWLSGGRQVVNKKTWFAIFQGREIEVSLFDQRRGTGEGEGIFKVLWSGTDGKTKAPPQVVSR